MGEELWTKERTGRRGDLSRRKILRRFLDAVDTKRERFVACGVVNLNSIVPPFFVAITRAHVFAPNPRFHPWTMDMKMKNFLGKHGKAIGCTYFTKK
jgi:hypothetical protein